MKVNLSLRPEFERLYERACGDSTTLRLLDIEGIAPDQLDMGLSSFDFFDSKLSDISTDANSNATEDISPSTYRTHLTNSMMKLLGYHMLWHFTAKRYGIAYADKAIMMIWNGDLYFHDAHGIKIQMPYCYAFSLDKLVLEGRPYGTSPNTPPKRRKSFISQVDKLIGDLSKQFAGATAPSDFFLWYSYFALKDRLDPRNPDHQGEIINDFQGLTCLFNESSRAEGEPPFVNIGLYDEIGLENLFGHIWYPDSTRPDMKYIMDMQELFADWFSHGDPISGFPYRFPVVTMNMTTDKHNEFVDDKTARSFAKYNRRMGNFNLHYGDKAKLAMCCRYENNLDDMGLSSDSFGNGGVNIGSHRLVTPNIPRAAYLANGDISEYYRIMDEYMDVASKLLIVHRYDILQHRIDKNPDYLKFFGKLKWFSLRTMFSTFGITGIHEAVEMMGSDILTDDGTELAQDMLQYMKDKTKQYRKEYGIPFNMEEIPGEQACVSLASKDNIMYGVNKYKLYSNQYIPLTSKADLVTRTELSGRFMSIVSGGGIVHQNVDKQIDTDDKMYQLMRFTAKSGVTHHAICHRFGRCANGHAKIVGQGTHCPICGERIITARMRVIGYFSDEQCWNPVRREYDAPNRHFENMKEDNNE